MIFLNDKPLDITKFPDGCSQVWKIKDIDPTLVGNIEEVYVKWEFEHEGEFMQLAQLKTLLDTCKIKSYLELPYLPYGRQDKYVMNMATFGLRTFAQLLNFLNFDKVFIDDPHSNIALELINNSKAHYPKYLVQAAMETSEADLICYPDKGARTKYENIYSYPHIYGEKVRDQETGNITNYQLIGDPKGKRVLIVDDICDGGATFIMLTQDLLKAGAKEVNLFVSHGLFTKGIQVLRDSGIKRIFTTKQGEI